MPSPPYKLNALVTQGVISLPFTARWVYIDNATSSSLLVRLGGTDYPSLAAADLRVPANATVVMPTAAKDFAAIFASPALLGKTEAATIVLGMAGEQPPAFGSISPPDPVHWSVTVPDPNTLTGSGVIKYAVFGVRHVATSIAAAIGNDTGVTGGRCNVGLFDGDDIGPLLPMWQHSLGIAAQAHVIDRVVISPLRIIGSSNTDMTLDFTINRGDFRSIALTGFDVPG